MNNFLDAYSRRARLLPGAIVVLPITLFVVVLLTTKPAWWTAAASLLVASGLSYFGAQLVRSLGTKCQIQLWSSWGGQPTTTMLRFRGAQNSVQVARWHRLLAQLCPDETIPDAQAEDADVENADEVYETLATVLRARTRDRRRFGRVFDENCQYGFRRNLYGCRRIGLYLTLFSFATAAVLLIITTRDLSSSSVLGLTAVMGLDIVLFGVLKCVVTSEWVHQAAISYATLLLESVETLILETETNTNTNPPTT